MMWTMPLMRRLTGRGGARDDDDDAAAAAVWSDEDE